MAKVRDRLHPPLPKARCHPQLPRLTMTLLILVVAMPMSGLIRLFTHNKEVLRVVLAVCMVVAGVLHFAATEPFVRIVPDFLPAPTAIVYISGVIEIALGLALLVPPLSSLAAWGLVALFIAVYPANLNMAINHIHIDGIPDAWWFQAIRLPFQFVLIAWAYWYTKPHPKLNSSSF